MHLSFLKSAYGMRAVKTFTSDGVQAYPQIKRFDSTEYELENTPKGLRQKTQICQEQAAEGACMLKGYLTRPLVNESRAGMVDREAPTDNLILDIDGIVLPDTTVPGTLDRSSIQVLAEKVVQELPTCFRNTSYIVHASSSMGMKGNKVCLHLDFMLAAPVQPQALKEYVVYLNHALPVFNQNFSLSASGTALRFPLDRTVVDNSHLIFLGHPEFVGEVQNPIPDAGDRIFFVEKNNAAIAIGDEITEHADATKNQRANDKKVNELRMLAGLPKRQEKVTRTNINGQAIHVVTNPESCAMAFASDNGDFVAYNVNGGDSGGYFVLKYKPAVVRNFKGEPNFLFEFADPETYQWHLETFIGSKSTGGDQETSNTPPMPMVFRDEASNAYYNALIDTGTGRISRIAKASREGLPDWMVQYEGVMPDNVPIWNYEFQPHRHEIVSFRERFINKYLPSPYMMPRDLPESMTALCIDTAYMIGDDCPMIAELILHVLGRDMTLFGPFLNWLAAAFQTRDKLTTAWVLQGTQGTGKGVLFEDVITPLVGTGVDESQPYATKVRIENVEDQFNQWMECALFIAFDEFRLSDSPKSQRLFNKIKSMISETSQPVRGMRENLRNVRSYSNYLIFSNDQDVIYVPEGDRRFNIAPRQEVKLSTVWADQADIIEHVIPRELSAFALHMQHFDIDLASARTAIENAAKREMRRVSRTTIEDFVDAVQTGNLEFFLPIMEMPYQAPGAGYVLPAQTLLKEAIRDYNKRGQRLSIEQLRVLYVAFIGPSDNSTKFGKMVSRYGLNSHRIRVGKTVTRGFIIDWNLHDNAIDDIKERYLDSIDQRFGDNVPDEYRNVVPMKQDSPQ